MLAALPVAVLVAAAGPSIAWRLSPAEITAGCGERLAEARRHFSAARSLPGLEGLRAVEQTLADLNDALVAQKLLGDVSADPAIRGASEHCSEQVSAFGVEVSSDPAVYALAKAATTEAPTPQDQMLARLYLEAGRKAGAELDAKKRERLTRLLAQIRELEFGFMRALASEVVALEITDGEAISLPDSIVTRAKSGRRSVVAVNDSTIETFMKNEPSREARRRYFIAYARRGGRANVRRLEKALRLRRAAARLLGFRSWAELQLGTRMAKSPDRALAFLRDVDEKLLPKARQEVAELARRQSQAIAAWDYEFARDRLERETFGIDSEAVRRYLPLHKVVPKMIALCERLFGLTFRSVTPAQVWAEGVSQYEILDARSGAPLAFAYLDLEPREGKMLRPASFPLRAARTLPDGTRQLPMSAIIGNAPPGKPPLLSHKDVVDLFHEFGHLLHTTLSTAKYASLDGAYVRRDFVEAPSQMFESFMWQPDTLREISAHVDSGEPLPGELARALTARRQSSSGAFWTRQVLLATHDLLLHGPQPGVDATKLWFDLARKLTAIPPVDGTYPEASFIFLMGGYDAGYYGYLWSRVHAADMFTAFQQQPAEAGPRFRREVLEPGASVEPEDLVRNFLGRAPSPAAFYADLGL
jgi:thimet oligopeptidase